MSPKSSDFSDAPTLTKKCLKKVTLDKILCNKTCFFFLFCFCCRFSSGKKGTRGSDDDEDDDDLDDLSDSDDEGMEGGDSGWCNIRIKQLSQVIS